MKRTCTILFAAIVSLLSTGCQVFIYQPQAVDIPLINHQGDTRVDAAVGISTFLLPNRLTLNATGTYGISPTGWPPRRISTTASIAGTGRWRPAPISRFPNMLCWKAM